MIRLYTLRLYHDSYAPDSRTAEDLEAQHSIAYVLKGSATINGEAVGQDKAVYCKDVACRRGRPGRGRGVALGTGPDGGTEQHRLG